jgi:hypothetical protein
MNANAEEDICYNYFYIILSRACALIQKSSIDALKSIALLIWLETTIITIPGNTTVTSPLYEDFLNCLGHVCIQARKHRTYSDW